MDVSGGGGGSLSDDFTTMKECIERENNMDSNFSGLKCLKAFKAISTLYQLKYIAQS